ncbi:hypothetical protein BZA05DRAFT_413071 [Tricharina praecox]|uniref:uncharacterized protein n=1 Tax=Tricharina praecox TaxID=43433 RepID=UPI00221E41F8|nr:uncharacterized protein BZA05DRAFT_413071 [Tricharina praecox]KAI5841625.1 hypothetical protein BZA05DRAFT_413071 [Tricharina praecox]
MGRGMGARVRLIEVDCLVFFWVFGYGLFCFCLSTAKMGWDMEGHEIGNSTRDRNVQHARLRARDRTGTGTGREREREPEGEWTGVGIFAEGFPLYGISFVWGFFCWIGLGLSCAFFCLIGFICLFCLQRAF